MSTTRFLAMTTHEQACITANALREHRDRHYAKSPDRYDSLNGDGEWLRVTQIINRMLNTADDVERYFETHCRQPRCKQLARFMEAWCPEHQPEETLS